MRASLPSVLWLLVSLSACSDDGASLIIELGTDYVPGEEFTSVSIEINEGTPTIVPVALGQRFFEAERLTEIRDLTPGPATIVTQLLDAELAPVAGRRNEIDIIGNTALLVVISRNCESVTCPGVEDPVADSECLGRRCVPPTCHPGDIGACGGVECDVDSQCESTPDCLSGRCVGGACLYTADDTSCEVGQVCDPVEGCVGGMPDGGMDGGDAAVDGAMDSAMDAAVDAVIDAAPDVTSDATMDTCVPSAELCDGVDNDCDPATADGVDESGYGDPCDGADTDLCDEGTMVCTTAGLVCDDMTGDNLDRCDGGDYDCDGAIDEGLRCAACTHRTRGASDYLFCDESRSWASAEAVCVSAGGHLVTIDDMAENDWVRAEKNGINGSTSWYIGYTDMAVESSWVWIATGLEGSFVGWASGRPSGTRAADDCAIMPVSTGWIDVECFRNWNYICEW